MQILKVFETEKIMTSKILKSVVLTSIKNILLAIIAINQYVLMINLVSLIGEDAAYNFVNSVIKESKYWLCDGRRFQQKTCSG